MCVYILDSWYVMLVSGGMTHSLTAFVLCQDSLVSLVKHHRFQLFRWDGYLVTSSMHVDRPWVSPKQPQPQLNKNFTN